MTVAWKVGLLDVLKVVCLVDQLGNVMVGMKDDGSVEKLVDKLVDERAVLTVVLKVDNWVVHLVFD